MKTMFASAKPLAIADCRGEFQGLHISKIVWLDWLKTAKQFSVNSHGKFLCQYQASRQTGKQALGLPFSVLRILNTFHSSLLGTYFTEIYCTFYFRQMFN